MSAYMEGIEAVSEGLEPEDNPYHDHTYEYKQWNEGYQAALDRGTEEGRIRSIPRGEFPDD